MEPHDVTYFAAPADFRDWFESNHSDRDELWVGFWKKPTGRPSITWPESVDVALCFGWIDGIRKRIDDEAYTIRFTPRRRGSTWSLRNIERYGVLDAEGLMHNAGRAAYDRRREEPLSLAPEFEARLRQDEAIWTDWSARSPSYKKKITHWLMSAKRPETRERRLAKLLAGLRDGTA